MNVFAIPLRTRFRGITVREGVLLRGDDGRWGEWSPFLEYDAPVAEPWLALRRGGRGRGLAGAAARPGPGQRDGPGGRAGAGAPDRRRGRLPHRQGQGRRAGPDARRRRGPARGGARRARTGRPRSGSTPTAPGRSTTRSPRSRRWTGRPEGWSTSSSRAPSVEDLAAVRRRVDVPIAADESIRRAEDPYRVRDLEAADIAVLKVQPLGGVRACLRIAEDIGLPVVVSSALETSVGIAAGLALAAALPELPYACGLATVQLLTADVAAEPAAAGRRVPARRHARRRPGCARPAARAARTGSRTGRRGSPRCEACAREHRRDRRSRAPSSPRCSRPACARSSLAPGSRNAPLSFAAYDAAEAGLVRLHTRIDERSAGFLALGLTKVGSAGRGDLHLRHRRRQPAPGPARGRRTPACRWSRSPPTGPARLRGTDANQTTDQVGIFGRLVAGRRRRPTAVPPPVVGDDGPLHLNVQLDEPLVPDGPLACPDRSPTAEPRRRGEAEPEAELLAAGSPHRRGGRRRRRARRPGCSPRTAGWPLLAEPSSGARTGANALRCYRLLLDGDLGRQVERVVVAGHPTLSRPVTRLLSRDDVEVRRHGAVGRRGPTRSRGRGREPGRRRRRRPGLAGRRGRTADASRGRASSTRCSPPSPA